MVAAIPARFKRVMEAFEEVAKVRCWGSSSGGEHFPAVAAEGDESLRDLSDLVNSFLENGNSGNFGGDADDPVELVVGDFDDLDHERLDSQWKNLVESLLGFAVDDDDEIRRGIRLAVEEAGLRFVGDTSSSLEFKWRLMTWLRERGYDAGLCKTKWERNGQFPSGHYEYIDINVAKTRYIIEISLASEFDIARPSNCYVTLLENIPPIFVGQVDVLKQLVRLMCSAIKMSMKSMNMSVPPWRRHGYVQSKWFSSYKRSTHDVSRKKVLGFNLDLDLDLNSNSNLYENKLVGFVPQRERAYFCREELVGKNSGFRVGNSARNFMRA